MKYLIEAKELVKKLKTEHVETWFDLGLFIDRFKEQTKEQQILFPATFNDYKSMLKERSIGFVTFYYSVDGVTIEVEKYPRFRKKGNFAVSPLLFQIIIILFLNTY